jgi:hypothetical protein
MGKRAAFKEVNMARGFLAGLGNVLNAGAAYLQHVNFVQRALGGAPQEVPALLTAYTRGLSDASFIGFKMTLAMLIGKESDAARKVGLQQISQWSDSARRGEFIATPHSAVPVPDAEDDFDQDMARTSRWYEELNDEQRQKALIEHILLLTPAGYQRFMGHLQQMQTNIAERITEHEANEANAWGGFAEDRIAYRMAGLQTGQRDPAWMRQLAEYQGVQTFVDWLLRASELLWRNRDENEAVPARKPDAAKIRNAVREFAASGRYPGGADQMQKDVAALVVRGEADEVMAILEAAGGKEGGHIADHYRPGDGQYELRWPIAFPLPLPFEQRDRPTQFSVLYGEWTRRATEAAYALLHGDTAGALAGYEESLARAEQIEVPELVARSHEGLASVAAKANQRLLQRSHLKLAVAARAST